MLTRKLLRIRNENQRLIASGLTVFGIIFALIGLDPQLAMKVDSSDGFVKEFSREIEPNDDKFKEKTKDF